MKVRAATQSGCTGAGLPEYLVGQLSEIARLEAAVLIHAFSLDPDYEILPALVQDVMASGADCGGGVQIERAILNLVNDGFLRCEKGLVVPVRNWSQFEQRSLKIKVDWSPALPIGIRRAT